MSATVVREKMQTTLPADVAEAAGIEPGDQVDWHFEDGKIVGQKLSSDEVETVDELPPKGAKISGIRQAVRDGRR
jgi:bifunctional DNA-binding transcriptional regulator/antitoxin component of YhaV-PrlF toxin-antitoxin module